MPPLRQTCQLSSCLFPQHIDIARVCRAGGVNAALELCIKLLYQFHPEVLLFSPIGKVWAYAREPVEFGAANETIAALR